MSSEVPSTLPPRPAWHGVVTAFVILAAHLLLIGTPLFFISFFPGLTQWLVVIPLALYWRRYGDPAAAKALLITAGVIFFLNTLCFGAFVISLNTYDPYAYPP